METNPRPASAIAFDLGTAIREARDLRRRMEALLARALGYAEQLRPVVDAEPQGILNLTFGPEYDPLIIELSVTSPDEPVEIDIVSTKSRHDLSWPQTTDEPDTIEVEIDAADAYLGPTEDVRLVDPPSDQFPTTLAKPNTLAS